MNSTINNLFDELMDKQASADQMIGRMIDHFRSSKRPVELFEALKMQTRCRLGLPLVANDDDPANSIDVERQLESGLLDACREAGEMLITSGQIAQGWMYLRPLDDPDLARRLIGSIAITDENYDEVVQVLLHEGVDVGAGYQAVIEHQGTCNSITTYDQWVANRGQADRQAAATKLLDHLYQELTAAVRADIANRDQQNPAAVDSNGTAQDLGQMLEQRPWLLDQGVYHLDTTHLSAAVRIATVLESTESLQKARQLTAYGHRLNHQYQYPGEEPFVDFYPAHAAYYDILLGKNVDAGLKQFERKARTVATDYQGTQAIETYLDLLDRAGQSARAVIAAIELLPDDFPIQQIIPTLLKYASRADSVVAYDRLMEFCRGRNDLLGFAVVAAAKTQHAGGDHS